MRSQARLGQPPPFPRRHRPRHRDRGDGARARHRADAGLCRRRARRPDVDRHLAELSRPADLREFHRRRPASPSRSTCSARTRRCWPSCRPAPRAGACSCRPTTRSRPTRSSASSSRSTWRSCRISTAPTEDPRFTARGHDRRQDLRRAEELGHHRLRRQHQEADQADDQLEGVLGHGHGRGRRPHHGARLPADHDRQCARNITATRSTRSKPDELAKAEELLLKVKPHLFAITSDYQPAMRDGDAWMTMCWTE